jgi:hypothetical protein
MMSLSAQSENRQNGSDQDDAEAGSETQAGQRRSNAPNIGNEEGQECERNADRDGCLTSNSRSVDVRSSNHAHHFSASGAWRAGKGPGLRP